MAALAQLLVALLLPAVAPQVVVSHMVVLALY
jgi:hypothetical protein